MMKHVREGGTWFRWSVTPFYIVRMLLRLSATAQFLEWLVRTGQVGRSVARTMDCVRSFFAAPGSGPLYSVSPGRVNTSSWMDWPPPAAQFWAHGLSARSPESQLLSPPTATWPAPVQRQQHARWRNRPTQCSHVTPLLIAGRLVYRPTGRTVLNRAAYSMQLSRHRRP